MSQIAVQPLSTNTLRHASLGEAGMNKTKGLHSFSEKRDSKQEQICQVLQTPPERWKENDREWEIEKRKVGEKRYVQHDDGMRRVNIPRDSKESNHVRGSRRKGRGRKRAELVVTEKVRAQAKRA